MQVFSDLIITYIIIPYKKINLMQLLGILLVKSASEQLQQLITEVLW